MNGVGVQINELDMFSEYKCILTDFAIGTPGVQTKYVQIPLRNGSLDLTEYLTGSPKYDDRAIKMKFMYQGFDDFEDKFSDIQNAFHGKKCKITFDRDPAYYYLGRLEVSNFSHMRYGGTFEIEGTCEPFKYQTSTGDDWLWDPFDFEEGYINELSNIEIDTEADIVIVADEQLTYATVVSDAQFTVTYKSKSITITSGTTTLYDFEFEPGNNTLHFAGTGTISINYRGARL